jgi:hypothetical protein
MKKNHIHVHHDVIYQFAVRLKAIRDKACPVDFFPQPVPGAVRLRLPQKSLEIMGLNLEESIRLPSPPWINFSVRLSVRPSIRLSGIQKNVDFERRN